MANNVADANMLFFPPYCDIINVASKNHTDISFITWFCRKSNYFWDFKNKNSVRITEGLDNGDSDNRGPTVYM